MKCVTRDIKAVSHALAQDTPTLDCQRTEDAIRVLHENEHLLSVRRLATQRKGLCGQVPTFNVESQLKVK